MLRGQSEIYPGRTLERRDVVELSCKKVFISIYVDVCSNTISQLPIDEWEYRSLAIDHFSVVARSYTGC